MSTDINTKIAQLLLYYRENPIEAIESLFSVEVDEQQRHLINCAHHKDARVAVKSCQGAGKTATLVWLSLYYLLTLEDCRVLITSPSANQLSRVFHSEILKWHAKMAQPFKDFFEVMKESVYIKGKPYQCANLVTASATNQENLAGGHSTSYVVMVDEASAIAEEPFDTLLGTLGSSEVTKFIMTSNPVRNSGRFYEIFAKDNQRWDRLTFTAQGSNQTNDSWMEDIKAMYGEDSDNYRIRVLGEFGRFGENQFFPADIIEEAVANHLSPNEYVSYPIVAGLDVARFGSDSTVFTLRQGPRLLDITEYHGLSTMEVAAKAIDYFHKFHPVSLMIDGTGLGAGVVDRLAELKLPVVDVVVGTKSSNPREYSNLRSQLYGDMSAWLSNGADILEYPDLLSQLNSCTYTYNQKMQIQLMTKKDIKKQGLPSPDIADSIALTFAAGAYGFIANNVEVRKVNRINRRNWV